MDSYSIPELLGDGSRVGYLEILRKDSLSIGVYMLPRGGVDPQKPHTEDEAYYVVSGSASITASDEERAVGPGDLIFIAKGVEHRFHTISADLTLLVFFAPAEGSAR